MRSTNARSGSRLFTRLLLAGQRVDWRYSLVVVLVITGMFSTPLALGSIRNRVYAAVREQIEKENNAREIDLTLVRESGPRLDASLIEDLERSFPGLDAVGNRKLVATVEGPEGADFLTLQTLDPGDPRTTPLGIVPEVPRDFGLHDLILSDGLGVRLYGEGWEELWTPEAGFQGEAPSLSIHELPLEGTFRVVARRTLPGMALYVSPAAGRALRRFTLGFGAAELGLPVDEGLVRAALPNLATDRCRLLSPEDSPTCTADDWTALERRLLAQQHEILTESEPAYPVFSGHRSLTVALREAVQEGKEVQVRPRLGDCREVLSPLLVDRCAQALVVNDLRISAETVRERSQAPLPAPPEISPPGHSGEERREIELVAVARDQLQALPEWERLRDLHGAATPAAGEIAVAAPEAAGLTLGESLRLDLGDLEVPVKVGSFYRCEEGGPCPWILEPQALFRLRNLLDGVVEIATLDPLVFVPTGTGEDFDQILAYAPVVEEVPEVVAALRQRYPDLNIQYNSAALAKLERQDSRLSTLFSLTMGLSALFLILALAALAQINLERRSRQVAQMLILGFRRGFVRRLVVAEYLLLTGLSALASLALTSALFLAARALLGSTASGSSGRDFAVIVESMSVDPWAFLWVFAGVLACTGAIAVFTAKRTAAADPLRLLD